MTSSNQDSPSIKKGKKNTIQGAQAFHRAITLLKLVANNNQKGMRLVDIAQLTGLTIPTTHRLLQALLAEKLLYKIEKTNLYAIGALVYELGFTAKKRFDVLQVCTPIIELLARKTSACALLSIQSDDDVVCLVKVDGGDRSISTVYAGERAPLGVSATGLALLSLLPKCTQSEITQRNGAQYSLRASLSQAQVAEQCNAAKANGYALIDAQYEDCQMLELAVPVFNHRNECVASVAVLLVNSTQEDQKYKNILPNLKNAASDITLMLDGRSSLWEL